MYKIYISAPYSAHSTLGVDLNIARARQVAIELWNKDFAVFCPHLNTAHFDALVPKEVILRGNLTILATMDAMLLWGNWQDGNDCQQELDLAQEQNIPFFETVEELISWRKLQLKKKK